MTSKFFPEALFELGFTDLVSVIPPGAQLTPSSKISPSQVGKVPGRRLGNGLWAGYDWRKHEPTIDDVRQWCIAGANVGIRADRFPGVDIDCTDDRLGRIIEEAALAKLGPAPVRVGRAPKRLLMYRAAEPFSRMRLWIEHRGEHHLVEVLGQGQQYLIHGTHPSTMRPYEWLGDLTEIGVDGLTAITREMADEFLTYLAELLDMLSVGKVEREGDGRPLSRTAAADQQSLLAPSVDLLREAVSHIPNTNELFPDRTSYLKVGYAIRAACGDELDEGYAIFAEWAAKWEGNDRAEGNDPDVVLADWRRMKGPYAVGWSWLAEQARAFGFVDASLEFEATEEAPAEGAIEAPLFSDQWLADRVAARLRQQLRFVPQTGRFLCWDVGRWFIDAELLAEDAIKQELRVVANEVQRWGSTPKEQKEYGQMAVQICSAGKAAAVRTLVQSDRTIAVSMDALDHDPWVLNTPGGIVDLRTGKVGPADPDALCTRSTAVPADFNGACPEWHRFLAEATGGDAELERYLQRFAGYALTGSTREQQLAFIWGRGGNGKSIFLNAITGILGDYARTASMDTFTVAYGEKHTTDIAMLVGARLVTASETQAGKRWDEARVKALTGGEPVTARFMRQDNFTFTPQFKLLFVGNHKPEVRDVDEAMRRRIHLVPFTVTPAVVDKELGAKLREEWPAILAWMIEGCLAWQQMGLAPPPVVQASTAEYFAEEDAVGRWLADACETDPNATVTSSELYDSWREWANANGEFVGSLKRLSAALVSRRVERWRDPVTRRMGFRGIKVVDRQGFGVV